MTEFQKAIKYLAMGFAGFLAISIFGGILGVVGLFGGFFTGDTVSEDLKSYSVSAEIDHLEIEIYAADLSIKEGDAFLVESNLEHLKVEEKDGLLKIRETRRFFSTDSDGVLTVYVPAGTVFDSAVLTAGAGRVTVQDLSADALRFELGAGEVSVASLTAYQSADIDGGAGRITISGGALNDLDLDMGVGQLNLRSGLIGDCELDLGIGETNISVIGNKDDYKLDIEKGLGNITVDGKSVSDYENSGNGTNSMEINGGIGAIHVKFEAVAAE